MKQQFCNKIRERKNIYVILMKNKEATIAYFGAGKNCCYRHTELLIILIVFIQMNLMSYNYK